MSKLIPAERLAALQTQLLSLRQQNFEISHREKKLRIDLENAQRDLASALQTRPKVTLPSQSSASASFNGFFRKLKPRSSSFHIKPSSVQPDYGVLVAENESLKSTIRKMNTRPPEKSTIGNHPETQNEDEKMEELVMSFEISSGRLPLKKTNERSKSTRILKHEEGGKEKCDEKQNEIEKVKEELKIVSEKMNVVKGERDRILADYVSALELLKDLKSYGEERRRFAEMVVREKEELCQAHEHNTIQLRNNHQQTICTLRSGLTAHITALQRELQLASARIRSLESLLEITSDSVSSSNTKPHSVTASSYPSLEKPTE